MTHRFRPFVAVALAAALVACSSGKSASPTTSTVPGSTAAPTTSGDTVVTDGVTTTAAPATTAPAPSVPVYPLTGLPITDEAASLRPALVVKIDNNAAARPQSGLNEADIVFEEIVEVQTRFAAVFQSQTADPVGPIRSGRTQDIMLLGSFNHPLFMWSGGNGNVTRAIEGSDFVNLSAQRSNVYAGAGFFRSNDRKSPHNLYASASAAWTLAPEGAEAPPQQFNYLAPGTAAAGAPAAGVDLDMFGLAVGWRYDPASGLYLRTSDGRPHNDALSGQVSTNNVIVMVVDYQPSPADAHSPEAQTIGSGEVYVYTGGVVVHGTWTRGDRLAAVAMTDDAGNVIRLTPGRTFVELAKPATFQTVS